VQCAMKKSTPYCQSSVMKPLLYDCQARGIWLQTANQYTAVPCCMSTFQEQAIMPKLTITTPHNLDTQSNRLPHHALSMTDHMVKEASTCAVMTLSSKGYKRSKTQHVIEQSAKPANGLLLHNNSACMCALLSRQIPQTTATNKCHSVRM
jgi:hypothetical protein